MRRRGLIALGGNLGQPQRTFVSAMRALDARTDITLEAHSSLYRTSAVGGPAGQAPYLNAVVSVSTNWTPQAVLAELHRIELSCGRERRVRWGPRTLDLDLLLFDDLILDSPQLCLPHPRLHERLFVLEPLREIAADLLHPVLGRSIAALHAALTAESREHIESLSAPGWLTLNGPDLPAAAQGPAITSC